MTAKALIIVTARTTIITTIIVVITINLQVKMKAMEIGVTDASAENLRRVGFPEKMSPGASST